MIILDPAARQAIAAHAEATYPDECVGLLLGALAGDDKQVVEAAPAENSWAGQVRLAEGDDPQSRRDRFYLDAREYLRIDRAARARGLEVVGCYHSHPDAPPRPSERDRVGAQGIGGGPAFAFLIQNVTDGAAGELAGWLLLDDGARFAPEPIDVR